MFHADESTPHIIRRRRPLGVPLAKSRSVVVAGAVLALTAAGGAVLAPPAHAVASERVFYTCTSPDLGTFTASAIHRATPEDRLRRRGDVTPRPVEVVYSGWVKVTTTLQLPAKIRKALESAYVSAVDGIATTQAGLDGTTIPASEQDIAKTEVPTSGPLKLVAAGYANIGPAGINAGNIAGLDLADISGNDFTAQLYTYDGDDRSDDPMPLRCQLDDDQELGIGEVSVIKAPVRGRLDLDYDDSTGKVVSTVGVFPVYSSAEPTGTMTLILKRDGERIATVRGPLKDGRAVMRTTAPKEGRYVLIERFTGDRNFFGEDGRREQTFS